MCTCICVSVWWVDLVVQYTMNRTRAQKSVRPHLRIFPLRDKNFKRLGVIQTKASWLFALHHHDVAFTDDRSLARTWLVTLYCISNQKQNETEEFASISQNRPFNRDFTFVQLLSSSGTVHLPGNSNESYKGIAPHLTPFVFYVHMHNATMSFWLIYIVKPSSRLQPFFVFDLVYHSSRFKNENKEIQKEEKESFDNDKWNGTNSFFARKKCATKNDDDCFAVSFFSKRESLSDPFLSLRIPFFRARLQLVIRRINLGMRLFLASLNIDMLHVCNFLFFVFKGREKKRWA